MGVRSLTASWLGCASSCQDRELVDVSTVRSIKLFEAKKEFCYSDDSEVDFLPLSCSEAGELGLLQIISLTSRNWRFQGSSVGTLLSDLWGSYLQPHRSVLQALLCLCNHVEHPAFLQLLYKCPCSCTRLSLRVCSQLFQCKCEASPLKLMLLLPFVTMQ